MGGDQWGLKKIHGFPTHKCSAVIWNFRSVWYPLETFLFAVFISQNLAQHLQFGCSKYYTSPQGLILCVWCNCNIWFQILEENSKFTFSVLNTFTSTKCLLFAVVTPGCPFPGNFWFCCFSPLQMLSLEGSLASFLLIFATDSTTLLWVTQPVTNLTSACWIRTQWRKKRDLQQTMLLGCPWRE